MAKVVRRNRVTRIKTVSGTFFVNAVRNEYARTDVVVVGIEVAASRTLETKGNRNERWKKSKVDDALHGAA